MKNKLIRGFLILVLTFLFHSPSAHAAKMALSPGNAEFKAGCLNVVNLIINTEGSDSMAADAFLRYNPNEIEIVDQMPDIPGIQLRIGSVYESYPGNITSSGSIRLTAFNRAGFFNGRGVLASIAFRSKPDISQSTINFSFSPGSSTDSNVADPNATDILNGVYGGTYSFKPGRCTTDTSPPTVEEKVPDDGAIDVPLNSNIEFTIRDNSSGVDLSTLTVQVNDQTYLDEGGNRFEATGRPTKYKILVNPMKDFLDREPITVRINASDKDGNRMNEVVYSFNELIPVGRCPIIEPVECPDIRPAAPLQYPLNYWWLIVLLIISILLNLKHMMEPQKARVKKAKFRVRPVPKPRRKRQK